MTASPRRFSVALSFPGEYRTFVERVALRLADAVGRDRVLYDRYYEAEFARPNLDTYLQSLYHDQSELIVVFLCAKYNEKEWCGLEGRALRDLIKQGRSSEIMPLRFDEAEIPGLFSIDGYIPIGARKPEEIADLILQRLRLVKASPARAATPATEAKTAAHVGENWTRREFDALTVKVIAAILVTQRADRSSRARPESRGARQEILDKADPSPSRLEALSRLLKPDGRTVVTAAQQHRHRPEDRVTLGGGYPQDLKAKAGFLALVGIQPEDYPGGTEEIPQGTNLFCAGSPVSSDEARLYLPHCQSSDVKARVSHIFNPWRVPYHFVENVDAPYIEVVSASLGGKREPKRAHGIKKIEEGELWHPREMVDSRSWLNTDFLLVTRLPRDNAGGEIILATGGHGAGVGAFRLLFDEKAFPEEELISLLTGVGDSPYFQFVLEAFDMDHTSAGTVARRLRVAKDCPPRRLPRAVDLFTQ